MPYPRITIYSPLFIVTGQSSQSLTNSLHNLYRLCMFTTYDGKVNKSQAKVGIFMAKTYVLDTNVLIQAPYALQCFEENHLVLPLVILEELDGLKKSRGRAGLQCPAGNPHSGTAAAIRQSAHGSISSQRRYTPHRDQLYP